MTAPISIRNLTKCFGTLKAVDDVSLEIASGELFFLLGPSGCGKTTLLRCIAGFHQPEAGEIRIGEASVVALPPYKRNTGMVFQNYALWPHLSVARNVAFGLEMRRFSRAEIRRRVALALETVRLSHRAGDRPNQLSGGQQQRVALARALVIEPRCLLLDEPLSNLDARLRIEMRGEIRRICKAAGLTAIYVTHDQKEALSIADRMAVMRDGRVEQVGAPAELYRHPRTRFVAEFIGEANFIEARVRAVRGDALELDAPLGRLVAERVEAPLAPGARVTLCLRPEAIRLDPPADLPNRFTGRVVETVYQGEFAHHRLQIASTGPADVMLSLFEPNPLYRDHAERIVTAAIAPTDIRVLLS